MKAQSFKLSTITLLLALSGCATVYSIKDRIPGLDRIISSFSKAEVGPVKDLNGDIISETVAKSDVIEPKTDNSDASLPNISIDNISIDNSTSANASKPSSTLETAPLVTKVNTIRPAENPAPKTDPVVTDAVVTGTIKLKTQQGFVSPKGVIVSLKRNDGGSLYQEAVMSTSTSHEIDMEDKVYAPGNMVIRKGDTINFVNKDEIQHNVFSSSGENAFDLGTFGSGLQRAVKLNKEGVVKVYCNIHPGMAAYVAVDDVGVSQVLQDDSGLFTFSELPAGEYTLSLWSIRGQQIEQFSINESASLALNFTFDTSNYQLPERADKYGEPLKKRKKVGREFY